MAVYQFDVEHARLWGVNEAIFLQNLIFWLRKNKAEGRNVRAGEDGVVRVWTFSKTEALAQLYPFWKTHQVRYVIDSLRKQEVIVTGNFADQPFDRTLWFAVTDESLLELADLPDNPGEGASPAADAFEKFRKSKRENPQKEKTNSTNGSARNRKSSEEQINRSSLAEADTAATDNARTSFEGNLFAGTRPAADSFLVEELVKFDLNRGDALRFAAEKPDECRQQLAYLPYVTEFKSTRGAYLCAAIKDGFAPPKGFKEAQQKAAETEARQRRQEEMAQANAERERQTQILAECLATERARLETEEPDVWAALIAKATENMPAFLKGMPHSNLYAPQLERNIERLLREKIDNLDERVEVASAIRDSLAMGELVGAGK